MKATLEFQLPEDSDDHRYALAGVELASAITAVCELMRRREDGIPLLPEEVHRIIVAELEARDLLWICG